MHEVGVELVGAHGLERSGADVQRDERAIDAAGVERAHERFIEMQACRRCGDGPWMHGEHALVTLAVRVVRRVADVRGQWNLTPASEEFERRHRQPDLPQIVGFLDDPQYPAGCRDLEPFAYRLARLPM